MRRCDVCRKRTNITKICELCEVRYCVNCGLICSCCDSEFCQDCCFECDYCGVLKCNKSTSAALFNEAACEKCIHKVHERQEYWANNIPKKIHSLLFYPGWIPHANKTYIGLRSAFLHTGDEAIINGFISLNRQIYERDAKLRYELGFSAPCHASGYLAPSTLCSNMLLGYAEINPLNVATVQQSRYIFEYVDHLSEQRWMDIHYRSIEYPEVYPWRRIRVRGILRMVFLLVFAHRQSIKKIYKPGTHVVKQIEEGFCIKVNELNKAKRIIANKKSQIKNPNSV